MAKDQFFILHYVSTTSKPLHTGTYAIHIYVFFLKQKIFLHLKNTLVELYQIAQSLVYFCQ